jgi:hypothetical protein
VRVLADMLTMLEHSGKPCGISRTAMSGTDGPAWWIR